MTFRHFLVLTLALLPASITGALAAPPDTVAKIEAWNRNHPGGLAVVQVDAEGLHFHTTGKYAADDDRAISPDTVFEIGSLTKVFTGLLLAQEKEEGLVKETDDVAALLLEPGDPAQTSLKGLSLLSLATHASGLPRLPSNMTTAGDNDPYVSYTRKNLLEALREDGRRRGSGAATSYSNFGIALLGEALADAAKTDYASALQSRVIGPLGLTHTTLNLKGRALPKELAPGHANGIRAHNWAFDSMAPAGGLLSSARDLGRFLQCCLGFETTALKGAILECSTPRRDYSDIETRVGLVWFVTDVPGGTIVWHNGLTGGYASFLGFDTRSRKGVALLTNHASDVAALGFELLGSEFPKPRKTTVKSASDYIGRYPLTPDFNLDITEANSALFLRATGQDVLPLRPVGPDRFAVVGVPAELSFDRDTQGAITSATLHQNGAHTRGKRTPLPAPTAFKEMAMPDEQLKEYIGTYEMAPGVNFEITHEPGKAWAKLSGQQRLRIFPSAKDEFFYKAVDAQLSFRRDASGKVIGLILHQAGHDVPAKKAD